MPLLSTDLAGIKGCQQGVDCLGICLLIAEIKLINVIILFIYFQRLLHVQVLKFTKCTISLFCLVYLDTSGK